MVTYIDYTKVKSNRCLESPDPILTLMYFFSTIRTQEYQSGEELRQTANELLAKVDDPKLKSTEVRAKGRV